MQDEYPESSVHTVWVNKNIGLTIKTQMWLVVWLFDRPGHKEFLHLLNTDINSKNTSGACLTV